MSAIANHEVSVSIPIKSYEVESLTASASDVTIFGMIAVVMIPLGLIIAGMVIWLKRRKK